MKRLIETLVELYSRIPGPALANLRGCLGALPMQREGTLCLGWQSANSMTRGGNNTLTAEFRGFPETHHRSLIKG